MNAPEEMATVALVQAATVEARRRALQTLYHGKGIRLTEATRDVVRDAINTATAPAVLAPHTGDAKMRRLEHGKRPIMCAEAERDITDWIRCWRAAAALHAEGATPPGPLLLHGPPGTGKTTVTRWLASEFADRPTFVVDAHEWTSSLMGDSARNLADRFAAATGAVLVLEEVDAAATMRSNSNRDPSEVSRITVALFRLIEGAVHPVVMTTNRLDVLDPALLRRCDAVVEMPEPTADLKSEIVAEVLGGVHGEWFDMALGITDLVRQAKRVRRMAVVERAEMEASRG